VELDTFDREPPVTNPHDVMIIKLVAGNMEISGKGFSFCDK